MKLTIATGLYESDEHRVSYFKQYLEHVVKLDNLDQIEFVFFAEPGSDGMIDMIPDNLSPRIIRYPFHVGLIQTNYNYFYYCLEVLKRDYVVTVDDDVILMADIYNLCTYAYELLQGESVLCLMNRHWVFNKSHKIYETRQPKALFRTNDMTYFSGWGIGITRHFWLNYLKPVWSMTQFFDWTLIGKYHATQALNIYIPCLSRAWHIGDYGVNYEPSLFKSQGFAEQYCLREEPPTKYKLIEL